MPRTSAPWEHWPVFRHSATPLLATVLTFCFPPSRRQMDVGKPRAGVSTVTHSPASGTPLCVRKRGPRPTGEHTKCELRGTRRSRSRDRAPEVAVLPTSSRERPRPRLPRGAPSAVRPESMEAPAAGKFVVVGGGIAGVTCAEQVGGRAGGPASPSTPPFPRPRRRRRSGLPPSRLPAPPAPALKAVPGLVLAPLPRRPRSGPWWPGPGWFHPRRVVGALVRSEPRARL